MLGGGKGGRCRVCHGLAALYRLTRASPGLVVLLVLLLLCFLTLCAAGVLPLLVLLLWRCGPLGVLLLCCGECWARSSI